MWGEQVGTVWGSGCVRPLVLMAGGPTFVVHLKNVGNQSVATYGFQVSLCPRIFFPTPTTLGNLVCFFLKTAYAKVLLSPISAATFTHSSEKKKKNKNKDKGGLFHVIYSVD